MRRCFSRDGLEDLLFSLRWDHGSESVSEVVTGVIERENSKADVTEGKIKWWSYFTQAVEEFDDLACDEEDEQAFERVE